MAKLPNSTLETHESGTLSKLPIINANWRKLEAMLDPDLSSSDPTHGALYGVIQAAIDGQKRAATVLTPSGTVNISMKGGATQQLDITVDTTFTIGHTFSGRSAAVLIKNTSAGSKNLTWPASNFAWADTAVTAIGAGKYAWIDLRCLYNASSPSTPITIARGSVAP